MKQTVFGTNTFEDEVAGKGLIGAHYMGPISLDAVDCKGLKIIGLGSIKEINFKIRI